MSGLIQCVPNFSEGRGSAVIAAIVGAIEKIPGIRLADWSADADHHRLVVTFVGPPAPVQAAALAAAAAAVQHIDLRGHSGVHPRHGALDVLPFVPLTDISLEECAALACDVGREIAERHGLPVFLYEAATSETRSLPFVRKNVWTHLLPDYGPPTPHPTAGVAIVGARGPLIAYNVVLATPDIHPARLIARELRTLTHLPGIRALGLCLPTRGLSQVSMNLTLPDQTPMLLVYRYIQQRAAKLGTSALGSEVIGALPGPASFRLIQDALNAPGLKPGQILRDNWPDLE